MKDSQTAITEKGSLNMDYSLISIAATAITTAKEIGKAAIGVRDFNQIAATMSQINDQLLKAQDSLFAHNTQLMALQQENFESREELRKLKEALAERGRYTLFKFPKGHLAYRVNITPQLGGTSNPTHTEPEHYICQPCFDNGRKAVLQRHFILGGDCGLICPVCKTQVFD